MLVDLKSLKQELEIDAILKRSTQSQPEAKRAEALDVLDQLKEKAKQEHVSAYFVALIYTGLGDKDLAFVWLNKACQDRDYPITRLKDDLRFDNIRSDPRFADLMRCVGLPQ